MSDASAQIEIPQPSQSPRLTAIFWALLVLAAAVRLVGIDRPLVGNFATKNVVYAMVARNWAQGRTDLRYPMLDCLVGGRRSLHMLEFPASAYLTGSLWRVFGGSLDIWGRATAVAFSTASVAMIFLFVRRRHGPVAALGAGAALALSPVSIIYGQSFMLEPSLVFFTLATFYCLDRWLAAGRRAWLTGASVCFALLLLTKVYMLVLLLPLAATLLRAGHNGLCPAGQPGQPRRRRIAAAALTLAILPAAVWYWHAMRTAAPGGPLASSVFYSVRQSGAVHCPPHPLLRSPDFYRQLLDDLTGVVLTPVGFMLLLVGVLDRAWRGYAVWLLAMLVLVVALPLKFHEMNYYYLAVLPPLCVVAGLGWQTVYRKLRPGRAAIVGLLAVALVFSLRYAVGPAFVTPEEDRAVVVAGAAVQALADDDEPVVTMHGSTIDLLYYCNRPGWAIAPDDPKLDSVLDEHRRQGARFLVVAGPEAEGGPAAIAALPVVQDGDGFRIYALSTAR